MRSGMKLSLSLFWALADYFADWHGTCLLYSGGSLDSAEHSFLALFPFESAVIANQTLAHQKGVRNRTST